MILCFYSTRSNRPSVLSTQGGRAMRSRIRKPIRTADGVIAEWLRDHVASETETPSELSPGDYFRNPPVSLTEDEADAIVGASGGM